MKIVKKTIRKKNQLKLAPFAGHQSGIFDSLERQSINQSMKF